MKEQMKEWMDGAFPSLSSLRGNYSLYPSPYDGIPNDFDLQTVCVVILPD